jgi:hypothetical protein
MHFPSLVDVLALCNYCILANVLDYNTYQFPLTKDAKPTARQLLLRDQYDYNALSPVKRQHFSYVRGLAINFMRWLMINYNLISTVDKETNLHSGLYDFIQDYMGRQARAILNYKQKAEAQGVPGIRNCTAAAVRRQLKMLFLHPQNIPFRQCKFDGDLADFDSFAAPSFDWEVVRMPAINFKGI